MKKSPFRIKNGILEEYLGRGDDVTIPQGVKIIGRCAFWGKKIFQGAVKNGSRYRAIRCGKQSVYKR